MSFHFIVRMEPLPGKEDEFRRELLQVIEPSRAEPGCIALHAFESVREPRELAIHSEWADEAAFETHTKLPHTVRFVEATTRLLREPLKGLRAREIA